MSVFLIIPNAFNAAPTLVNLSPKANCVLRFSSVSLVPKLNTSLKPSKTVTNPKICKLRSENLSISAGVESSLSSLNTLNTSPAAGSNSSPSSSLSSCVALLAISVCAANPEASLAALPC